MTKKENSNEKLLKIHGEFNQALLALSKKVKVKVKKHTVSDLETKKSNK